MRCACDSIQTRMSKRADVCTATGFADRHLPPGPERDEVLGLIRVGWKFTAQRKGRRPGPLAREMLQLAQKPGAALTFDWLLDQLESAAARRSIYGPAESCVTEVNRIRETIIYDDARAGRIQITFKRARNLLTAAKKSVRC